MSTKAYKDSHGHELSSTCIKTAVSMLVNIVETACEHESDLELMRMVNFIDLYRTYLSCIVVPDNAEGNSPALYTDSGVLEPRLGKTTAASFEQFISDSRLLQMAAAAASRECGVVVATPPPLKISANGSKA